MRKKFFLLNTIEKILKKQKFDMDELQIMDQARRGLKASEVSALSDKGNCTLVPLSVPPEDEDFRFTGVKRGIDTEQYLIGSGNQYIINPISEVSVFIQAGARYMPLQTRDIKIPSFSGILAQWLDAGSEPADDGDEITIDGSLYQPKRLYALLDIPYKLIYQGGPEVERWLRDNITAAIAQKVDETIGGVLAATAYRPQGAGYKITTGLDTKQNALVPTYDNIAAMEDELGGLNAPLSDFAYITNAAGRRILRTVFKDPTGNSRPVYEREKLNDYRLFASNFVSNAAGADGLGNLLLFGLWKDLIIAQFGAYIIQVDPYTLKLQGKIQLGINAYFDFKGARGSKATDDGGVTDPDQYAYSFSSLAIKASS